MNRITLARILSLLTIAGALAFTIFYKDCDTPGMAFRAVLMITALAVLIMPFIKTSENTEYRPFFNGLLVAICASLTLGFTFEAFGQPYKIFTVNMDYVPVFLLFVKSFAVLIMIINLINRRPMFGKSMFARVALFTMVATAFVAVFYHFAFMSIKSVKEMYELGINQFYEIVGFIAMYGYSIWLGGQDTKDNNDKIVPIIAFVLVVIAEIIWKVKG